MRRTLFSLLAALIVPMSAGALPPPVFAADDAGSGTDAPDSLVPRIMLERDVFYHGQLQGTWPNDFLVDIDIQDTYAFEAEAGDEVFVWVFAPQIMYAVYSPDGTILASDVTGAYARALGLQATAPVSGTYFLKFIGEPQGYCFAYDLDDHTSGASLLMLPGCTV